MNNNPVTGNKIPVAIGITRLLWITANQISLGIEESSAVSAGWNWTVVDAR